MNDRLDDAIRAATAEIVATAPPVTDGPVAAATQRRKVPYWAMASLSMMPVFGFIYVRALTEDSGVDAGPLGRGAEVYNNCASCHGADGQGVAGSGYQFSNGEVLLTFPNIDDQMRYVYYGTAKYVSAGVEVYGNPARPGGAHLTGARGQMTGFGGQLTDEEIIAVVCHERYTLAGADPNSEQYSAEFTAWCADDAVLYAATASGDVDLTDDQLPPPLGADDGEDGEDGDPIVLVGSQPVPGRP